MRRFLLTFAAALSVLLLSGILAAWAFSHHRRVELDHDGTKDHQAWHVRGYVSKGVVMARYSLAERNFAFGDMSWSTWKLEAKRSNLYSLFDADDGFADTSSEHWQRSYFGIHLKGYSEVYGHADVVVHARTRLVLVPLWAMSIPFTVLPAVWLMRARPALRRCRLRAGLCTHCGYDLRASPERCPECGTAVRKVQRLP